MCKYVVFHSEEFNNPVEVFFLAFMVVNASILCEITNALNSMDKNSVKSVKDVIAKFVGFKILIQI
jgi:hypothetical protein